MPEAPDPSASELSTRVALLEARLAALEQRLGATAPAHAAPAPGSSPAVASAVVGRTSGATADFEFQLGQNWFAVVGIVALALGAVFMLTLPYPAVAPVVPSLVGLVVAAVLFGLAHWGRSTFALVSGHVRGAGMALLYFATLRLFYFGTPVLPIASAGAIALLTLASAANLAIAWIRGSPRLMALALVTAGATPLAVGEGRVVVAACAALAVIASIVSSRPGWRWLLPVGIGLTYLTYFSWAVGDPFIGGGYRWATEPAVAPLVLLLVAAVFGTVRLWWRDVPTDAMPVSIAALLNCVLGYGAFLLHTAAVRDPRFAPDHVLASVVFLWLATLLWARHRSQVATFFYAMCGYAALSAAIVKASTVPDVFVWLSMESIVVVATAIWFRSRFIVLTNFIVYVAVVLGYIVLSDRETGVSIGFGVVALVSARVLNWQRHRLNLKTEFMRNAYLLSAFVVFPYALFHLAAPRFVALAWVGLAVVYYAINVIIRNQKYRWMGHGTLLLTTIDLLIPGHHDVPPAYRVVSFLALGSVLLIVSMVFTRARAAGATTPRGE